MATSNVRNVNADLLNTSTVKNAEQALQEDRERERRAFEKRMGKDSVEIASGDKKLSVASSAEPAAFQKGAKSAHLGIQESRDELKKAYRDAGGEGGKKMEDSLDASAADLVNKLDAEIEKLHQQGAPESQIAKLEAKRENLLGALDKYREAHTNVEDGESPDLQTASAPSEAGEAGQTGSDAKGMSEEEKGLWTQVDTDFKTLGIDRAGETNMDDVQKKFMARIGSEVSDLQTKEKGLNEKYNELQTKYKTATPAEKADLEKSIKDVKAQLDQIGQRKLELQKLVTNFSTASDALLSYHVSNELGLQKKEAKRSKAPANVQSASVKTQSTSQPTGAVQNGGSPAGLTTQSVGGENLSDPSFGGVEGQGPHLNTASAQGDSYVAPDAPGSGNLKISAADLSGTTMSIQSTSTSARSQSNRIARLLKQLIMAMQSGNMDAVVSGVVIMSKRMSLMTAAIGMNAIKAMQQYEQQTGAIASQISALSSKDPDYSSKLAGLNTQVSIASSARQQIVQTLQQVMSGMQESDDLAHSLVSKYGQIGERLAQFQ